MLLYWIWFSQLKELSPWQKKELLQHFETPEDLYFADASQLAFSEDAEKISGALGNKDLTDAEEILCRCEKKAVSLAAYGDPAYPERLRNIADPPMLLYYRGTLPDWEAGPFLGVVGTRKPTAYGRQLAGRMGEEISLCGATVVSGGAYGVDSRSMEGALQAGGSVVGVLGCGVDVIYPRTNRRLFHQVEEKGCLLSEYPPGEPPLGWHFLRRNRLISGISHGILVVEAPEKSGALNTARHAWEQGRDVYAVPANVGLASSAGSTGLLREGAMAVVNGWDAVRSYAHLYPESVHPAPGLGDGPYRNPPAKVAEKPILPRETGKISIDNREKSSYSVINSGKPALTDEEQAILALVNRHPVHPDEVAAQSNLPAGRVQSVLTMLTVKGYVCPHPGGLVSLK